MPFGKYLSDYEKGKIAAFEKSGKNISKISNLINRSRTVIKNFFQKGMQYGVKKGTKGNAKLDKRTKRRRIGHVKRNCCSSSQVKSQLELHPKQS